MSSEWTEASNPARPRRSSREPQSLLRLNSSQRQFVSELANILGVVALVAATPLFLLLLRLAIKGKAPVAHPMLLVSAGLLMLATVAGVYVGISHWLNVSRWREARPVRLCFLSVPALTLVTGVFAVGLHGWGWLNGIAGATLLFVLCRAEWVGWSQIFAFGTEDQVLSGFEADDTDASLEQEEGLRSAAGGSRELRKGACDTIEKPLSNEQMCQRIERRLADGQELISVWQRVEFLPFARSTTIHIPFWPPLTGTPSAEHEVLSDSGAHVRIEQLELHGCRLKVQLDEADERPQYVEIEAVFTS